MKMNNVFFSITAGALLVFAACSDPENIELDAPTVSEDGTPDVPVDSSSDSTTVAAAEAEFTVTIENTATPKPIFQSGVFAIPVGGSEPAPLFPGDAYEFEINAGPNVLPGDGGTRLSFVTMMVQSNDLFFAPDEEGIALYNGDGTPICGSDALDVTDQVLLWDAGTEVNEATGGPNQKPQQAPDAEDQGEDENGVVTEIKNNSCTFGNELPAPNEVIKVTVAYIGSAKFKVVIKNVSDATTIALPAQGEDTTAPVPVSPGVYAVHTSPSPFFVEGEPAAGAGLVASVEGVENIAEDGFPEALAMDTGAATGLIVPLSPGAWAVHKAEINPLYTLGAPDFGEGLEGIAEDGVPTALAISLAEKEGVMSSAAFAIPVGGSEPGAIGPGGSYQFSFNGAEGDHLSLATMFVQSNDWVYATKQDGISLFEDGAAIAGDLGEYIFLIDAGTEMDEYPGAGLSQVIRQSALDSGEEDSDMNVRLVDRSSFPNIPEGIIKVTIEASN